VLIRIEIVDESVAGGEVISFGSSFLGEDR